MRRMFTNLVWDQMGFHTKYAWFQSLSLVVTDKWTHRSTQPPLGLRVTPWVLLPGTAAAVGLSSAYPGSTKHNITKEQL